MTSSNQFPFYDSSNYALVPDTDIICPYLTYNTLEPENEQEYFLYLLSENNSSLRTDTLFPFENLTSKIRRIPHFELRIYQKRGRHINNDSKLGKKHDRLADDNLQTKIQIHFNNFLIDLVNDVMKANFEPRYLVNLISDNNIDYFRYINHKEKKNINYNYLTNIFKGPIKNIITLNISDKYVKLEPNYNLKLYQKLAEQSKIFSDFLDMNYLSIFNLYYYNDEKPLEKINFKGQEIKISGKTKPFCNLLSKNKTLDEKLINLVKKNYLNNGYYNKERPFKILSNK